MNRSTPGLPVHHQLPEFTQTCVHRVSDAIQPSHPRSSPSSPAPNPSQHQSLFQWVHSWVLFLLWLYPFILSGFISPLISSSILGTCWPGELLFQDSIILPFHIVYGVLKARILKWIAIPFSSGPRFVKTVHRDPSVLGGPTWHS